MTLVLIVGMGVTVVVGIFSLLFYSSRKSVQFGTYQDDDGVSTKDSQDRYQGIVGRIVQLLSLFVGAGFVSFLQDTADRRVMLREGRMDMVAACTFTLWSLMVAHVAALAAANSPGRRFTVASFGAASSFMLLLFLLFRSDVYTSERLRLAQLLTLAAALVTFLTIPRRPDVFLHGRPIDRERSCSLLERLTYSWAKSILGGRSIAKLDLDGLPQLNSWTRARSLARKFGQHEDPGYKQKLWIKLAIMHKSALALLGAASILRSAAAVLPQIVMFRFLGRLDSRHIPHGEDVYRESLYLGFLLGMSRIVELWTTAWHEWIAKSRVDIPIQSTLSASVYSKSLRLPSYEAAQDAQRVTQTFDRASPTNHIQADSAKAASAYTYMSQIPMVGTKLIVTATFLSRLVGWKSVLITIVLSVAIMPLTDTLSKRYGGTQIGLARARDQRVSLLAEGLRAIRQIKLSATEMEWQRRFIDCRDLELQEMLRSAFWMCCIVFVANVSPIFLSGIPISIFALQNGGLGLSASVAFTYIDLFQKVQDDLSILPLLNTYFWDAWVSLKRLEIFLAQPEHSPTLGTSALASISIRDANITWHPSLASSHKQTSTERWKLVGISMVFPVGELSLITGDTGSGKSMLLIALAGEATILSGEILIQRDQLAIVTQSAWIQNATIRDNVLFGLPLDQGRYNAALSCCALLKDLEALPKGDLTVVGSKGTALSGGQRWRVALARALYSRAGVILLDDVLSAVDAEVRDGLVRHALMGPLAKGRTRILATHHEQHCLPYAAYAVHLSNGRATRQQHLTLASYDEAPTPDDGVQKPTLTSSKAHGDEKNKQTLSNNSSSLGPKVDIHGGMETPKKATIRKLDAYMAYFHASGGLKIWSTAILIVVCAEFVRFSQSWWLKLWTNPDRSDALFVMNAAKELAGHVLFHPVIYMLLSGLSCVIITVRCYFWYLVGISASRSLFVSMTHSVFLTRLHWLESTPHGQILSRFTMDVSTIDGRLPHNAGYMIECMYQMISIIIASFSVSPFVAYIAAALAFAYWYLGTQRLSATRVFQKLSLNSAALIQERVKALLDPDGLITIRSFGRSEYFMDQMCWLIDQRASASWYLALSTKVMDLQLGLLGAVFVSSVALGCILTGADSGTAGIALGFALKFSAAMSGLVKRVTTLEAGFANVARIVEYTQLQREPGMEVKAAHEDAGSGAPDAWPSKGRVEVRSLTATYSSNQSPVLKDVSFSIRPGERVGVVGRTGAGKSSLTLAFFKLLEVQKGTISIDGVDISTVSPQALRRRLFMILQDPYIFAGTIRSTLDPDNIHDDETILATLKRVRLLHPTNSEDKPFTQDLASFIRDGGTNLSQGQRQLLLLAQALLRRPVPKVILIDEATSAIDMETDRLIQATLRKELAGSTILCVSHRLGAVVGYDTVIVMEDGRVMEVGKPGELMRREGGHLWRLVRHSREKGMLEAL